MNGLQKKRLEIGVVTTLLVLLIAVAIWLGFDVARLHRQGVFAAARHRRYGGPMIAPAQIQGWMTFAYINRVFFLPANYLAQELKISDSRYPNLQISAYASGQKQKLSDVLPVVRTAVSKYLAPPQ